MDAGMDGMVVRTEGDLSDSRASAALVIMKQ
jgi:hypothetical protein